MVDETDDGCSQPQRSEERNAIFNIHDDVGVEAIPIVSERCTEILRIGAAGLEDGIGMNARGSAGQQRDFEPPFMEAIRELINNDF